MSGSISFTDSGSSLQGSPATYSTRFRRARASPRESSASIFSTSPLMSAFISSAPRFARVRSSSCPRGRMRRTVSLDKSWRVTAKDGFSVVVARRVRLPFSTRGRKKSCWAFEKRCSSSATRTETPLTRRRSWERPPSGAEMRLKGRPVPFARMRAMVDLPQPGGPQKSRLGRCSAVRSARRRFSRWDWPRKRSRAAGRMRSGRGGTIPPPPFSCTPVFSAISGLRPR